MIKLIIYKQFVNCVILIDFLRDGLGKHYRESTLVLRYKVDFNMIIKISVVSFPDKKWALKREYKLHFTHKFETKL